MKRTIRLCAALALVTIGLIVGATPAQAHTATGGASCSGAVLDAVSYDDSAANSYTLTVDQVTLAGTFGAAVHQVIPVPQDGAVHDWSYAVQAEDGSFHFADSGQVGPCGTPPVVDLCPALTGDQPAGTGCTQPPDDVRTAETTALECSSQEQATTTTTTTTPFVFDQTSQTWVAGTPVETVAVTSVPVQPRDCGQQAVDECVDVDGVQIGDEACGVGEPTSFVVSPPAPVVTGAPVLVLPAAGATAAASTQTPASHLVGAVALAAGLGLLGGLVVLRRRALAV